MPAALSTAAGASGITVWLTNGPDKYVRLVVGLVSALCQWGMAIWTVAGAASAAQRGVAAVDRGRHPHPGR
ncbi:hypothetical protein SAM23877_7304 [Streptomyces ambofaciens ATCC 23877]|uniref:Uncharacterized protein n=1 Tax=Streptomyces ambofaciens (strain ATCC 23877 / 3486 / DSM 40053 / JCM 4204 / NBRC 12836 / NRRL B-2516) TaxID=278992 RepID=A0A0K2B5M1_STRA7|nr:hypothetical protein SAM23877_7304 [Streptomyces ambofaciens ATCC 23877]